MSKYIQREGLTFDDILIIPAYSPMEHREDADPFTATGIPDVPFPVLSAPMGTVTGFDMVQAMDRFGGLGVLNVDAGDITRKVILNGVQHGAVALSPTMLLDKHTFWGWIKKGSIIMIDMAHGHSLSGLRAISRARDLGAFVISGNVATPQGARDALDAGADALRVGIGGGSACTTRIVTGVGYPQLSALIEIREQFPDAVLISDGGCKTTGDIAKALMYANYVILGGMLAGTIETPAYQKAEGGPIKFQGMASKERLEETGRNVIPEGVSGYVEPKGHVSEVLINISNMLRQSMAYVGAKNWDQFRKLALPVRITPATLYENQPRI